MVSERIGAALVALAALVGCEQIERIRENKAKQARSDELHQVQKDCMARTAELQKSLETETWGRAKDYQLQREGTEVWLWRSLGDGVVDQGGIQLGRICVLNPNPHQPDACDAQQLKIGRILLEMEEVDRRLLEATNALLALWRVDDGKHR